MCGNKSAADDAYEKRMLWRDTVDQAVALATRIAMIVGAMVCIFLVTRYGLAYNELQNQRHHEERLQMMAYREYVCRNAGVCIIETKEQP